MNSPFRPTFLKPHLVGAALLLVAGMARGQVTNQARSLTLQECIERALENNLEIRSQRITPTIQTWGVMGAQGVYDPVLSGGINNQSTTTWLSSSDAQGLGTTNITQRTRSWLTSADLSGKLPSGATYDFSAAGDHSYGNSSSNSFSTFSGDTGVTLTQPLLKNFGFGVNAATIRIARENRTIAIQNFVQFVMTTISSVANAYYELVYAIENHKSAVETRELARELLDQNRIQERVGTMSPLDVIQAEAGVAESEQSVITTARAIKDNENTLKRLICLQISEFGSATLVPVDSRASIDMVRRVRDKVAAKLVLVGAEVAYTDAGVPVWRLDELDWSDASEPAPPTASRDDLAEIIFTSGATSDPKGVLISHRNILANIVPVEREVLIAYHEPVCVWSESRKVPPPASSGR